MRLGIMIEAQEGLTSDRWREIARMTEDLGFDSLWRSDHFFSLFGDRRQPSLETWVSLTMLAQETKRIRFGILVSPITFRHPSLVARMAAQVDLLSGGRLEVGVGAGWNAVEYEAFGIPFPPRRTRFDMMEEGIQVMQALWSGGPANFEGQHYSLKEALCYPMPAQSPLPLVVGGTGEHRTLGMAARYAQHWNAAGSLTAAEYPDKLEALRRHCAEIGRDPSEIWISKMAGFAIGRDEKELREYAARISASAPGRAPRPC